MTSYDKNPVVPAAGKLMHGYAALCKELQKALDAAGKPCPVLVIDGYPGVRFDEILGGLMEEMMLGLVIDVSTANLPEDEIEKMLSYNITDDRVFGVMSCHKIEAFFDEKKLAVLRRRVNEAKGGVAVVYGPGAALVTEGDVLVLSLIHI